MWNTTREASLISSMTNIVQSSADERCDPGTGSRSNIPSTTTTTKAENVSKLLLQDFDFVEESFEAVKLKASQLIAEVHEARHEFKKLMLLPEEVEGRDSQLKQLRKKVIKLKSFIPFNLIGEFSPRNISDLLEVKPSTSTSARSKRLLTTNEPSATGEAFSFNLEKLDLQCVPETVTRSWLNPTYFQKLKKLYIRGGKFHDLGQQSYWNVEILRLRHLSKFNLDCSGLNRLFPKLVALESSCCPNVHYAKSGMILTL